ncbi:MAG: DsrE family protein [Proteobacteria bacterium]|nr:DsrE family protein [Pseudomonadota bacterium]
MSDLDRRSLVGVLAAAGGAIAATAARSEPAKLDLGALKKETDIACLYHCDFGDAKRIGQMQTNIANHLSVYDADPFKLKIVVVAHGAGIKPFLKDLEGTPWASEALPPEIFGRYVDLAKSGVEVYLCQITFKNNKIDTAKARTEDFIKMVPSGVATVGALQAKGFGYLKVG